jgi:hypothetical protein
MDYTDDPWTQSERFIDIICAVGQNRATAKDYEDMNNWINNEPERMDFFVRQVKDFHSMDVQERKRLLMEQIRLNELMANN